MKNKKENLIIGLNRVVNALKNDTIHYDWVKQDSCNCGVVAQSILGKNKYQIHDLFMDVQRKLIVAEKTEGKKEIDKTWQNGVKYLCPISGEPLSEVFEKLFEAGLSKSDIVHLEYMSNPAILKRSGISMTIRKEIVDKVQNGTVDKVVLQKHPNLFLAFFGKKIEVTVTEPVYKEVKSSKMVQDTHFYARKENLIKYLTAWIHILQEGSSSKESDLENLKSEELEQELLVAVAEENYEYATLLRDQINHK